MSEPRWLRADDLPRPPGVDDDAIVRVLRVPAESAGSRLDVFLSTALRSTSRTRAKIIANQCAYSVDGRRLRANDRVRAEDRIALWRPPVDSADEDRVLTTLYEDEHLLAIDKPAGLTVHPTARHYHATVLRMLQAAAPAQFFSLIHRLDKDTSGVLLVAKSPEADRAFKLLFEGRDLDGRPTGRRTVRKHYQAITWGVPPAATIEAPLEPDPRSVLRVKMRVAAAGEGLHASTRVWLVDRIEDRYARVRCELLTGRQHQIRVHLASRGCPVVGDKLYGPDERLLARAADDELSEDDVALLEHPRHALHAESYELDHPLHGHRLEIAAPFPEDLAGFWQRAGGTA